MYGYVSRRRHNATVASVQLCINSVNLRSSTPHRHDLHYRNFKVLFEISIISKLSTDLIAFEMNSVLIKGHKLWKCLSRL